VAIDVFIQLVSGFLERLVEDVQRSVGATVETYLLSTHDLSAASAQPLSANPTLIGMYRLCLGIADLLLVVVFSWALLRSQWERGSRPHYTLKVFLPRAMVAVVLSHFALLFGQMALDLNNALVHAAWTAPLPGAMDLPWSMALNHQFGAPLFQLGIRIAIAVMLLIIALTYVIRFALLAVLLVISPLASLCFILPETNGFARAWMRLFVVTVFMQFGQVLVLRFASALLTGQPAGPAQALYGLAVLYLVIKVPGLMNASAHLENKVQHAVESTVKHALKAANGTARTRAARS
jgi:hypothetical protein